MRKKAINKVPDIAFVFGPALLLYFVLFYLFTLRCDVCLYLVFCRSKPRTTVAPRSRPRPGFTSSGFAVLLHCRCRCCSMSPSIISPSWRTTRWLRLWAWFPCSRAPPSCGLTSQVKLPTGDGETQSVEGFLQDKAGCVWARCMVCVGLTMLVCVDVHEVQIRFCGLAA